MAGKDVLDEDDLDPNAGIESLMEGEPDDPAGDPKTPDDVEIVISAGEDADPNADPEAEDPPAIEAADDDLSGYSAAVQKRIMRERRLKTDERNGRQAEREGRIRAEVRALEAEKLLIVAATGNVDSRLAVAEAEWKVALENGDNDAIIKHQKEVNDLQRERARLADAKVELDSRPAPETAAREPNNDLVSQWKSRNRSWFMDPRFKTETSFTKVIDAEIAAEGNYTPDTPEYFAELDRRIRDKMPALRGRLQPVAQRKVPPTNAPSMRQAPAGKRGTVTLNKADIDWMHQLKLDPKNPEHVKEYARNKGGMNNG